MKSANTLVNYNSILESLSDLYETDLSKEQISLIAKKLLDANEKITIEMQSVDGNETKQPVHLTDLLDFVIVPNDETVVAAKEQIDLLLK